MAEFSNTVQLLSPSGLPAGLASLRLGAGMLPLGSGQENGRGLGSGWIAVTGSDRVRWLNGMVTNSVQALTPGEGAYSFLLSAQGRIQGDATVWAEAERVLLQTSADQVEALVALLDRFIIMDDVELRDLTPEAHGLLVAGPASVEKLQSIGFAARASKLLKRQTVTWQGRSIVLINAYSPLVPRFEVWSQQPGDIAAVQHSLQGVATAICTADDFEMLRIREGTPLVGVDIRDRDLPQETAQTRALHFNKGCYLGQEIVERIRSRGNVHRTFTGFTLHGGVPEPGTPLQAEGKPVGELTTVAAGEMDGQRLALGFIRREALERKLALTYTGGHAEPQPAGSAS